MFYNKVNFLCSISFNKQDTENST